jgi:hypothetical protein
VAKCHKQFTRVLPVATSKSGADIVPENVADLFWTMLLAQQTLRESCGRDLGNVLVFGNSQDLLFREATHRNAILERDHGSLSASQNGTTALSMRELLSGSRSANSATTGA